MYFNDAFVVGNLTGDPELFKLPSGDSKCTLTVATNRVFIDAEGDKQESTEFHTVIVFGKRADQIAEYLKKGSLVGVRGHLKTRSWPDTNHPEIKHFRTELIADHVELPPKNVAARL